MKNADDGLLVLAERAERATAEQQAEILNDAWDLLGPLVRWTAAQARRFGQYMDAQAYESAAMMLVPEGYDWILGRTNDGLTIHAEVGGRGLEFMRFGETPALALCSAALRAWYGDRRRG